jgi:hypothetical protein
MHPSLLAASVLVFVASGSPARQGSPTVYCTAKVNSLGCTPSIGFSGAPSASATSGFVVRVSQVRNRRRGFLFYGIAGRAALPFLGGTLCVAPGNIRRTPQMNTGGTPTVPDCSGTLALDMNAFAAGLAGGHPLPELKQAGTQVNCQYWHRDKASTSSSSLSDALEYTIEP